MMVTSGAVVTTETLTVEIKYGILGVCRSGGTVYTADLKSAAARIVGSNPTSGTSKKGYNGKNYLWSLFTFIVYSVSFGAEPY